MNGLVGSFSEPWVQRLGWVLIHLLWQGAGIALMLASVLRLLARASSNVRYVVIGGALTLCALSPVVTWIIIHPQSNPAGLSSLTSSPEGNPELETPVAMHPGIGLVTVAESADKASNRWQDRLNRVSKAVLPYFVGIWFCGVAVLTIRLTLIWALMRRMCLSALPIRDSVCLERFRGLVVRMQVGVPVRLFESVLVEVPTLIGWLRPTILLPASIFVGLTPDQLDAILAHELAHVRRYDYLVNLLQTVIETILFYHPAVWWISRKLREERENCCDDIALEVMQDRLVYATALAQLEAGRGLSLALTASGGSLLKRIRRIAGTHDRKASAWPLWILLIGILSVVCLPHLKSENPTDLGQLQSLCKKAAESGDAAEFTRLSEKIKSTPGQSGWQVDDGVIIDAVARGDRPVVQAIIDQGWDRNKYSVMRLGGAAAKSPGMRDWLVAKGVKVPEYNTGEALIDAAAREDIPEMDRLVRAGVDTNYRGESEWTPITKAAVSNKVESVRFLLAHGADPNSIKSPGWNYSGLCLTGSLAVADLLLAAGANLNATVYSDHAHIIDYCISNGPVEMVKWFIAHGVDPAKVKSERRTFLFNVANPEIAEILIQHGIDVNARDDRGFTALLEISGYSNNPAPVAEVLLKHGADPNVQDKFGITPLMYARNGATVDVLVAHGADLKARNKDGVGVLMMTNHMADVSRLEALIRHGVPFDPKTDGPTLLCRAAHFGQIDIIAYLLGRGVDPNVVVAVGKFVVKNKPVAVYETPLQSAVDGNQFEAAKFLLDKGAKIIGPNPGTITSVDELAYAVSNKEDNIARLLWDHGARGVSPLIYAIGQGQSTSQIEALIDQGASVNPPTDHRPSPLELAAKIGRLDLVSSLLRRGANIHGSGDGDEGPIGDAIYAGQDEVVDYLLQHGAPVNARDVEAAVTQSIPYRPGEQSKDHYDRTVKLLIDAGALKNTSPTDSGKTLAASLGYRGEGGNTTALKMLLDAGLNPESPMPAGPDNSNLETSVIGYCQGLYQKRNNPADARRADEIKPLLDLLYAADKGAAPKSDSGTQVPDLNAQIVTAVEKGDAGTLQTLINQGVDPKSIKIGSYDETLLFQVTTPEVAEILLNQGLDPNVIDKYGTSAFVMLCGNISANTPDIVRVFLEHGANPNSRYVETGITALMAAATPATIDLLVKHGANINAKDKDGRTVLSTASNYSPERLEALLRNGLAFSPKSDGPTLLMNASWGNNAPMVKWLLEHGVDPNTPGLWATVNGKPDLMLPMQAAVVSGQPEAAQLLIEHGAKTDGKMIIALQNRNAKIVKLLWEAGVRDISPLCYAVSQGASVADVQKLLDQGSPAEPPEDKQITPLGDAAMLGNLDVVKLLIAHHADVNAGGLTDPKAPKYWKRTPLVLAAAEGQDEAVSFLLDHGATPDPAALYQAGFNSYPYSDQRSKDHFEKTVRILIDAGALKSTTPEMAGLVLAGPLGTRQGPPNPTVLKMLLDAGVSPESPMPYLAENGEKPNTVIGYYLEYYQKNKDKPDHASQAASIRPLLEMLKVADKSASTNVTNTHAQALEAVQKRDAGTNPTDETAFYQALERDRTMVADSSVKSSMLEADAQMLLAIQKGEFATLKKVLEHAFDPNTFDPDRFYSCPVYWAVHFNQPEILKLLLEHFATGDLGPAHETPLQLAQRSHPDLVPIIEEGIKRNRGLLTAQLTEKLHSLHIDLPAFSGTPISQVTKVLLDNATAKAGYLDRRVNIGTMDLPPSTTITSPARSNIPIWAALQAIADANKLRFDVDGSWPGNITLYPPSDEAVIHPTGKPEEQPQAPLKVRTGSTVTLQQTIDWDRADFARSLLESGTTASQSDFIYALKASRPEIVSLFWKYGVHGCSPLSFAISQGASAAQVEEMVSSGTKVEPDEDVDLSPLSIACAFGNGSAARALLNRGANPNWVSNPHEPMSSPLWLAVGRRQPEIVQLLLDRGAIPNEQDVTVALLDLSAEIKGRAPDALNQQASNCFRVLVARGALEKVSDPNKASMLRNACLMARSTDLVQTLLIHGFSPNAIEPNGKTVREDVLDAVEGKNNWPPSPELMPILTLLEAAEKRTPKASADILGLSKPAA